MKKISLLICILFYGVYMAQTYHEQDKKGLRVFLRQPSAEEGKLNLEQLGLSIQDTLNWNTSEEWIKKLSHYNFSWDNNIPKRINKINISYNNLKGTFKGSYFINLEMLNLNGNLIILDISQNTNLTDLDCGGNQLTQLDISKNINLQYLSCESNQLTQLDISNNPELKTLNCSYNKLTQLDVSKNTNLEYLYCDSNNKELNQLDISKNTNLQYLSCSSNKITHLDVSKNINLYSLNCSNNQLNQINLPKSKDLYLYCSNNPNLKEIDITYLRGLDYSYNPQLANLDLSKGENLYEINCSNNKMTQLDISKNSNLQGLDCRSNEITQLDISKNTNLQYLYCDSNKLTQINLSENNRNLQSISCSSNKLTQLDVSKTTNLAYLSCSSNELTQINLPKPKSKDLYLYCSNNPNLKEIDVTYLRGLNYSYNPQLANLDLSKGENLYEINCSNNKMTQLDISKNSNLQYLYCDSNKLSQLDVSKNTNLQYLYCDSNKITQINLSENNRNLQSISCSSNKLTQLDVSKTTNLASLSCNSNELTQINLPKSKDLYLYCSNNPNLKEIDVTYLRGLNYSYNPQLANLDLSKGENLYEINCSNNKMTQLDISKNINLSTLYCDNNQLSQLDISKNSNLIYLWCTNNKLSQLDISNNPLIGHLNSSENFLTFSQLPLPFTSTNYDDGIVAGTLPLISSLSNNNNNLVSHYESLSPYSLFDDDYYIYSPQKTIWGGEFKAKKEINLSSEYSIDEKITSFEWFRNNQPIQLTNPSNGVFIADSKYVGDTLVCKMKNETFPGLTLEYKVFITAPVIKDHLKLKTATENQYSITRNIPFTVYVNTNQPEIVKIGLFDANNNQTLISRIDSEQNNFVYSCSVPEQTRIRSYIIQPYIENEGKIIVIQREENTPFIDKLPLRIVNSINNRSNEITTLQQGLNRNILISFPNKDIRDMLVADIEESFNVLLSTKAENISIGLFNLDGTLEEDITQQSNGNNYTCIIPYYIQSADYMIVPYIDNGKSIKILDREKDSYWMDRLPLKVNNTIWNTSNSKLNTKNYYQKNNSIKIYPNPTQDKVYINSDNKIKSLELYNFNGQLIKKVDNAKELSLEDLNSGVYSSFIDLQVYKLHKKCKYEKNFTAYLYTLLWCIHGSNLS